MSMNSSTPCLLLNRLRLWLGIFIFCLHFSYPPTSFLVDSALLPSYVQHCIFSMYYSRFCGVERPRLFLHCFCLKQNLAGSFKVRPAYPFINFAFFFFSLAHLSLRYHSDSLHHCAWHSWLLHDTLHIFIHCLASYPAY